MDSKLLVQMDNYNKIVKAKSNFKKSPKERINETYVQVRLESLESLWKTFTVTHCELMEQFGLQLAKNEYLTKDYYNMTEELYIDYKTELKLLLSNLKVNEMPDSCENVLFKGTKAPIELPKISIPKFSGKYTEWVTFRDLFVSLIHNNKQLDNVQKMHYLKSSLEGEAEQLLRQIPISTANYDRCWEQLTSRYNNKRFLSHYILKRLFSQRNITIESAGNLKDLIDTTGDCLNGLKNLGIDITNWDIIIIHILTLKLDGESRKQWEFSVTNNSSEELPTFEQFKEFLTNRYRALEFLDTKSAGTNRNVNTNNNPNNVAKFKSLHVSEIKCVFCTEKHRLSACKKFAKQNVDQRRDFVQSNNVCFNCLGANHVAKFCKVSIKCKLCNRHHHTLLHPKKADATENADTRVDSECREKNETVDQSSFMACSSTGNVIQQVLLATALVETESRNGSDHVLRALLDQGSQANFVTEATVQALKLKKIPNKGIISGVGGDKSVISKAKVDINIKSRVTQGVVIRVQAYVLKSITSFLPAKRVAVQQWAELTEIKLADPEFYKPNRIDLLLGAEVYGQVIQSEIKRGPNGTPVAQATSLGWILSGLVNESASHAEGILAFHHQVYDDEILKKFWELESDVGLKGQDNRTEDEKRCEEIFESTTIRDENGRYVVKLPFKTEDPDCKRSGSRDIAVRRLKGLEMKFKKDEQFRKRYKEVIEEYLHLGHMVEVKEPDDKKEVAVYLPHHAVVREDKYTTKVRVVFDASCKGKNGVSLNDTLLVGPIRQTDLRHLVMRWRQSKICLTADVVKMYRQVKVHEDDTDFQRLLWRNNESDEIKDYKLLRVTFGTACAPFLAVRALQQVSHDEGGNFPLAAERVIKDFYMDDLMTGCESAEEGIMIYKQMSELLEKGGFILQKWTSNNKELIHKISEDKVDQEEKESLNLKMDEIIKILGISWDRSSDGFRYTVMLQQKQQPETKRKIIAEIARLYDPLGWITPCIIVAKAMIQRLWLSGIGWDDPVPEEILNDWHTYRDGLQNLTGLQIPRWLGTKSTDRQRELHGFCDASKVAYAAVVYIRVIDAEGKIHVTLITAKSKVAPIKQVSIPRLELCGAVLLSRLLIEVAEVLKIEKSEIHAWTDSTIVLAWINSQPCRWKAFVANRVSEIITSMNPCQWAHVSSGRNPADCASRGITPAELKENRLWLDGPEFLRHVPVKYERPEGLYTEIEVARVHTATVENMNDYWERFSTLTRLVRVTAYCKRFLRKKVGTERKMGSFLTNEELQEALQTCIRSCQATHFPEEIKALQRGKLLLKKSEIKTLNPFLDEKGLLRVGGRLEQSKLPRDKKHPFLISKQSHLAKLIVRDAHYKTMHGGPQLMLIYITNKYWILGAKQLVKSYIRRCVICVKNIGMTRTPQMGQLPEARVTPSRSFSSSGVDFAGPIQIRTSKGRGNKSYKGYICLFVCMSTRAVHIEAVTDMTAQSFLQAFKRFVARRGHCREMWSDNGTNFVGAAVELKKLFSVEKDGILPEIAETLATNGTTWHFIPPHSPNFGGLWEAGIKSVKFHLKRVIGDSTMTYEEISTVLAQIESCLNSRPMARFDNDLENIDVLTPGHFLVGEPLVAAPDYNYESANVTSLRRWQYTQRMLQEFWRKWSQEYLSKYLYRYRWSLQMPEPKVGDVVVVKEDGLPPCRWLYGRIICTHPGKDNITRVVTIKTKVSELKRPVSKLCILPIVD